MNKSTMSVLLAAMMAVSGFAAAQTTDVKSGTQGGAGPTGASGMGDNGASVKSRAEVKAETIPQKSSAGVGSGTSRANNPNTANTSEVPAGAKSPRMTSAERKAQRAEARAARQARMSGNAGNTPMKDGKSSN
jgi:hypothetical protein